MDQTLNTPAGCWTGKKMPVRPKPFAKKCKFCLTDEPSAFQGGGMSSFEERTFCCEKCSRRNRYLKHAYGVSLEEYLSMEMEQSGVCAICSNPPGGRPLAVDHDHVSGKVRQLLCGPCNSGLGLFQEDRSTLEAAIKYLDKWEALTSEFLNTDTDVVPNRIERLPTVLHAAVLPVTPKDLGADVPGAGATR